MSRFPEKFMIGAATAAHQVEGNNIHSDYWAMEHMKHTSFNEPSLEAVDHYNRYKEDIRLMAAAGLNTYRFSIEWARIEPQEGVFDKNEIEHYRKVLMCCKENGIEPVVTMMHFTSPIWLIRNGGWESQSTVETFTRYCKYVVSELGDLMKYIVTINEANMGLQVAAIAERYKRQMLAKMKEKKKGNHQDDSMDGTAQVGMNFGSMMKNMFWQGFENKKIFKTKKPQNFVSARSPEGDLLIMKAHQKARTAMKEICPHLLIGLSLSLHDIQVVDGAENVAQKEWEEEFTHYLPYILEDDFFGLQNYTRSLIGQNGIQPVPAGAEVTQMDYEYYPQALEHVIRRANEEFAKAGKKNMPILVSENGVATDDDSRRIAFIEEATKGVANCMKDGIPVIGYCYWSLMDNFEWQKGFSMKFGLISVDRTNMKRIPKESLYYLGMLSK